MIALAVYRWLSSDVEDRADCRSGLHYRHLRHGRSSDFNNRRQCMAHCGRRNNVWLSDISVACDRFKAGIGNRAWGIPMYFCAQLCSLTILCFEHFPMNDAGIGESGANRRTEKFRRPSTDHHLPIRAQHALLMGLSKIAEEGPILCGLEEKAVRALLISVLAERKR